MSQNTGKKFTGPEEEELIDKFDITPKKELLIRKQKYMSKWYVDLRFFLKTNSYTGPTAKGIAVPVSELPRIIEALKKCI